MASNKAARNLVARRQPVPLLIGWLSPACRCWFIGMPLLHPMWWAICNQLMRGGPNRVPAPLAPASSGIFDVRARLLPARVSIILMTSFLPPVLCAASSDALSQSWRHL